MNRSQWLLSDLMEKGVESGLGQAFGTLSSNPIPIPGHICKVKVCAIGYASVGYWMLGEHYDPMLPLDREIVRELDGVRESAWKAGNHPQYTRGYISLCCPLCGTEMHSTFLRLAVHLNDTHKIPVREIIAIIRRLEAENGMRATLDLGVTLDVTPLHYAEVMEECYG